MFYTLFNRLFKNKVGRFVLLIRRENLHRLLIIIISMLLISTISLTIFEDDMPLANAFWWSIVTLTTVGYGDITPVSIGGRIIGIIIMFFGIGIIGMFTATIASMFVEQKIKKDRGMDSYNFSDHLILCEWNQRAHNIMHELRSDVRMKTIPIVLLADIETKPVEDDNLYFIRGGVNEENLHRANLENARSVIILGDDHLNEYARDAKVVLSTLTVETINRQAYTIVELADAANGRHCQRAHADEIIVGSEFSTKLISRAALDHGISLVISEILSSQFGNDLHKLAVPESMAGKQFIDIFTDMKREHNCVTLAIQKKGKSGVISNPPGEQKVESGDYLIVISESRPQL